MNYDEQIMEVIFSDEIVKNRFLKVKHNLTNILKNLDPHQSDTYYTKNSNTSLSDHHNTSFSAEKINNKNNKQIVNKPDKKQQLITK